MKKRRILLIEDHPITRIGVTELLNREPDLVVCGESGTASEGLDAIERERPDLVIFGISLNGYDGLELMKAIKLQHAMLPSLVLSHHDESVYAERALRAGARGYVSKREAPQRVLVAVRKVLDGEIYLSSMEHGHLLLKYFDTGGSGKAPLELLTDRELEVFKWIGRGLTTREIAKRLCLSVKTVETYRAHIKEKMNFETSFEMLRFAIVEWGSSCADCKSRSSVQLE